MHGANHEQNRRAGTENVIEMAGLGKACELIEQNLARYARHMAEMRDRLERGLLASGMDARVNGHPEKRLPNTSSISFRGMEADRILASLPTVAASAGAACHSDRVEVSHVLAAMNVPEEYAMGTLRFSVGRFTTEDEIDRAVAEICGEVKSLGRQRLRLLDSWRQTGTADILNSPDGNGTTLNLEQWSKCIRREHWKEGRSARFVS